jgi:tetratricopeptide (TPR) repeat protein
LDGARFVELDPLEASAATQLFGRLAGADRVAREGAASREVVRLCGGIPLAVCVSGARLAAHPYWPVSRIVRELTAERARLSALSLPGDLSVQAAFDASYQALPAPAALAYRVVALIPGPDFCADLAVAALNDHEQGQELLDTLVDASLLMEISDGRYRLHDLIRLHAQGQFGSGPPVGKPDVIVRSVAWYLREAVAADMVVLPGRSRLGPLYKQESEAPSAYASPAEAAKWLQSHLPGLLAAVQSAHDAGLHPQAWQLCEALWGILLFGKHYAAWVASHQVGLRSAQACADQRAEAQMHVQLGAAYRSLGDLGTADQHFSRALGLFREAGYRLGEAVALDQLGVIRLRRACYDGAISDFMQALAIHQAIGRPRGIALMNLNIGQALADSGRQDEAIGYLRTAGRQFAAIGESYHRARALAALGGALIGSGQASAAEEPLRRALVFTEELGATYDQAHVHVRLADLADALGHPARAARHLERALALFSEVGAPQADSVRTRLGGSGKRPAARSVGPSGQGRSAG